MPQEPKPQPKPHTMCPFMSGPTLGADGRIHLFRAACAGPICRLFDDDTQDCRFNDVNYEMDGDPDDPQDGDPGVGEGAAPDPEPEPDPATGGAQ